VFACELAFGLTPTRRRHCRPLAKKVISIAFFGLNDDFQELSNNLGILF
jgi:hypothetical protein